MSAPQHTVRNSLIDKERTFTLGEDALYWREESAEGELPYADIARVRLISYAGGGGEAFQCALKTTDGKTLKIRSHHYAGLGNFEGRMATYTPFMRSLLSRIGERAPDARFIAGSTVLRIAWIVIGFMLLALGALLLIVLFDGMASGMSPFWALLVLVLAVPVMWREIRKGNASAFDPKNRLRELIRADGQ